MENIEREIRIVKDEGEDSKLVIGGDFDARIGKEEQSYVGTNNVNGKEEIEEQKSKVELKNKQGECLLQLAEDRAWKGVKNRGIQKEKEEIKNIICWEKENVEDYLKKFSKWELSDGNTEHTWEELISRIKASVRTREIRWSDKRIGYFKWWDKQCKKAKRQVKSKYTKWKRGKIAREEYIEEKKRFRETCNEKREKVKQQEMEEIRKIKTEVQIWKYVNRERMTRQRWGESIKMEAWEQHFMNLLNGFKEVMRSEGRNYVGGEGEGEDCLKEEEIENDIRIMKKKKAVGSDRVPGEAWIYSARNSRSKFKELVRKIWNGEGIPKEWKRAIIMPTYKKGDEGVVQNYRGISILNGAYKIYAAILNERLGKEIEKIEILSETQAGFRKQRGVLDIFILQHIVERELEKKGRGRDCSVFYRFKSGI
ncbi:PREDICTED: uncharacterized protein PF11_0207-like [Eufriesea mexicana]|uniref:uncharacterized protein PF11_0207-like n=1 Tax=Eufriesea mexicana TaxID=516756 RepID=UPI00083BBE44|nr:PREDICTED: uncharacterized protein PF11_0207-like [Eufriesea mexicana]